MPTKEEMEKVKAWCRERKQKRQRTYLIERNPFREEMDWLRAKVFIEIDRPLAAANRASLVYDSTTDSLWQFLNGNWRRIEPSL